MLQRIVVQNLAIVPQASIEFGPGLNVLTGETGSGKSILIEAIALMAGQKASAQDVRKGEVQAFVEGTVELSPKSPAWNYLKESGIAFESNEVTIKRIIAADGKSKAFINNQGWTVSGLAAFSAFWLDVTSQHAHQKLMDDQHHLEVVDEFAHVFEVKKDYEQSFIALRKIVSDLEELERKKQKAREEQDYWSFQLKELKDLHLKDGELEELQATYQRSANSGKLAQHIERIKDAIDGEYGMSKQISVIEKEMGNVAKMDASIESTAKEMETISAQLDEVSAFIHRYSQSLQYNPQELEKLNERVSALQSVNRKYGSIAAAIEKKQSIESMLSLLDDGNQQEEKLLADKSKVETEVQKKADALTKIRKKSALELCKKISVELQELGMKQAKIECKFEDSKSEQGAFININGKNFTIAGQESAYFNFSPNPGEGFQPLSNIASGGELSRILLAIKSIAMQGDASVDVTFLFDEVDSGIGGETADRLGKRLSMLSNSGAQVLCVTHLAQIACYARQHLRVQKITKSQRTITEVELLSVSERKNELARMIGGMEVTDKIMAHASELLKKGIVAGNSI
ncbi:MAG: DNA repair protein RecN [Proteobacteria bacterium]|nr:DNA repair protein RecN [Pseudomonadota bacterium]